MRFKNTKGAFNLYAVTGTNTVAFGIDCSEKNMKKLLGFTVEKEYTNKEGQKVKVTSMGFKVFKERIENPVAGALYSTYDNPIQSFVWEDFGCYPSCEYIYNFTPLYDNPLNITRGKIFSITVETEPDWKDNDHSIFFNRGVASSQAYAVKFKNNNPDAEGEKAYKWLSRGLKEAIISFIEKTGNGDELFGCFYEFRHDQILQCLREAKDRGVKLHIIYDAKENKHLDSDTGRMIDSFPKTDNEDAIVNAGLSDENEVIKIFHPRKRNKSYISHNKFMVHVINSVPKRVWTGSTNISKGGIFGQTNVGHSIDDEIVAGKYLGYWKELKDDPESKTIKNFNEQLQKNIPKVKDIPVGVTCIFSPRKNLDMLRFYADLLDSADDCACITLAFGVHEYFASALSDNTLSNALTFMMLEKDDPDISDYIYKNNVIKAVGSYLKENTIYKWVRETNTLALGLNKHVMYVHTKFLLKDPLSKMPVVVTGSANFSEASLVSNDENTVIIKGNTRVADIYFTEFLRIFNHYYFRWVVRKMDEAGTLESENPAFLKPDDSWTEQYKTGKYKRKRVEIFTKMHV